MQIELGRVSRSRQFSSPHRFIVAFKWCQINLTTMSIEDLDTEISSVKQQKNMREERTRPNKWHEKNQRTNSTNERQISAVALDI